MDKYRNIVCQWSALLPFVKGKKSHQFTTDAPGANIYFNSSGEPLYVADDTPFTDFENHMAEAWYHEYYYTKTEVSPMAAINSFRNGTGSICLEHKSKSRFCWLWDPTKDFLGEEQPRFSITALLATRWYTVTDAY